MISTMIKIQFNTRHIFRFFSACLYVVSLFRVVGLLNLKLLLATRSYLIKCGIDFNRKKKKVVKIIFSERVFL